MRFYSKFAVVLGLILCLPSCSKSNQPGNSGADASGKKKYRIAVIPKGTTHEFWKSVHAGAENAAQELGHVEIIWKGPFRESDSETQINLVQDFITQRLDGICLAPNDSRGLVASVKDAQAEGIPVVIYDSG